MRHFFYTFIAQQALWLLLCYVAVTIAIAVDLITGVNKSRINGTPRTSQGYKRTCAKAARYFMPMICLSCIDIIASALVHIPVMTMIFGAYCIFCEWTSVMETAYDKLQLRQTTDTARRLIDSSTDLRSLLLALLDQINQPTKPSDDNSHA